MFRPQVAESRVETKPLAEDMEHLPHLIGVRALAAHARSKIAHVQFASAHRPQRP
jgi:hypothetical protein